jgi:ABC-2 type transport system ATP-binding protein
MKHLVEINNITVQRSHQFRLHLDTLRLKSGDILCIAGPNGSGKTTLIECLSGLLAPDSGMISLAGVEVSNNLKATKSILGYIPDDEAWFVKELCAKEYFALLAQVYQEAGADGDLPARVDELAQKLYFTNFLQPLEQLSHGNKKKVQLIAGLMHGPKVIIVDELRNGLDPLAVIAAEQILKQEAERGACVIATTHDLWWAERVADQILLLVDGRQASQDQTKHIVKKYGSVEKLFLQVVNKAKNAQPAL